MTADTTGTDATVHRLDYDFIQDPLALYRRLNELGPVHRAQLPQGMQVWLVTRYDDARAALSDPRLTKDAVRAAEFFQPPPQEQATAPSEEFATALQAHMLNSDPPDHTRLRKLVGKAFTMRRVEALRPRIEEITEQLLDEMAVQAAADRSGVERSGVERPTIDLLESFAYPLPITVICELLGVPQQDRSAFRAWSAAVIDVDEDGIAASQEMAAYLFRLIATEREALGGDPARDDPQRDNLLSALVRARDADDRLSEQELISMVFLLLIAGHETTVNLICNGMLALMRDPAQKALLRSDPTLLPDAVEEMLRYDSPVNLATFRCASEPVRIGDAEIGAGELVLVSLLGANHDPTRFADPDRLDITRPAAGHLAFGHGIHHCLGAPLARLEGEIAIGRLLTRYPDLELAAEPTELRWRESTLIRGLGSLPVHLEPAE